MAFGMALRVLWVVFEVGEKSSIHRLGVWVGGGGAVDDGHGPVKSPFDGLRKRIPGQTPQGAVEEFDDLTPGSAPARLGQALLEREPLAVPPAGVPEGNDAQIPPVKCQVGLPCPVRKVLPIGQHQLLVSLRRLQPANGTHGPVKHDGKFPAGHRALRVEQRVRRSQPAGPGGGSHRNVPRAGRYVIVAGAFPVGVVPLRPDFPLLRDPQQADDQRKRFRPGNHRAGVQVPRTVAPEDAAEIQLIGAKRSVVVFHTFPYRDMVGKPYRLAQTGFQRPARLGGRDGGKEISPVIIAAQGYRLPGVGIAHTQLPGLRPGQLFPLRAGHADGHIIPIPLAPRPKGLLRLCRPGRRCAYQDQAQYRRQQPFHSASLLSVLSCSQHSRPALPVQVTMR